MLQLANDLITGSPHHEPSVMTEFSSRPASQLPNTCCQSGLLRCTPQCRARPSPCRSATRAWSANSCATGTPCWASSKATPFRGKCGQNGGHRRSRRRVSTAPLGATATPDQTERTCGRAANPARGRVGHPRDAGALLRAVWRVGGAASRTRINDGGQRRRGDGEAPTVLGRLTVCGDVAEGRLVIVDVPDLAMRRFFRAIWTPDRPPKGSAATLLALANRTAKR